MFKYKLGHIQNYDLMDLINLWKAKYSQTPIVIQKGSIINRRVSMAEWSEGRVNVSQCRPPNRFKFHSDIS